MSNLRHGFENNWDVLQQRRAELLKFIAAAALGLALGGCGTGNPDIEPTAFPNERVTPLTATEVSATEIEAPIPEGTPTLRVPATATPESDQLICPPLDESPECFD